MKKINIASIAVALLLCTIVQASIPNQTRSMSDRVSDALEYDQWESYKELFESGSMVINQAIS